MGPVIFLPVFYSVLTVFPPRHRVCARGYLNTELINDSTEKGDYIVLIPEDTFELLSGFTSHPVFILLLDSLLTQYQKRKLIKGNDRK